ncbi:unnamed protein product [Medioppia subpectinata]|uniref:Complex 1 LYR protein domain-containing protein n=1 Tax=Medioppia subpectinata TaxID=1979941 RepID=A0A7R9KJF8_9ACAR|nr:unnamed protein product [Medioppia subpectinata]CAG2104652.1 unnamed protein product [Medioppia subpectinata]
MASRVAALSLYRQLIRESNKFDDYIYRKYAVRRVRDAFRAAKGVTDADTVHRMLADGHKNLEIIRRQAVINRLYKSDKLVVEGQSAGKANNT